MGQDMISTLLRLVEEDTEAFFRVKATYGMPKKTDQEKEARMEAIQAAMLYATEVPLRTMRTSMQAFVICRAMAKEGIPACVNDAGVGALAARAAVIGAGLSVKVNAAQLRDRDKAQELTRQADALIKQANEHEREVMEIVESSL
jgi:glutamate formiminotransferase/formiminotetrahydrofolate cyclodeaminase